jgi:acetyl esterase/lipase
VKEIGVAPDRIILAGGSAGGGLTAAVALPTRDREGPRVLGQMLMCPMLDDRNDTVQPPDGGPGRVGPDLQRDRLERSAG